MAPHSSTLAWKIPWTEEPGGLQSMGSLESDMTERLHFHFSLSCTGEGNGNPLQYSCLQNPRNRGACWAAVYGVAQSRTRLTRLSSSSSSSSSSEVAQSCPTLRPHGLQPVDCNQASPLMGFSRQEYWSGKNTSFFRKSSRPRDQTPVSLIVGGHFTVCPLLLHMFVTVMTWRVKNAPLQ